MWCTLNKKYTLSRLLTTCECSLSIFQRSKHKFLFCLFAQKSIHEISNHKTNINFRKKVRNITAKLRKKLSRFYKAGTKIGKKQINLAQKIQAGMMLKKKDLRLLDELLTPWFYVDCHPTVKSGGQPEEGQQKKIQTLVESNFFANSQQRALATTTATRTSKKQYATFTFPTMHLICTPKFCITFVFHFSWVVQPSQEKLKTMLLQNFGGQIRCIMGFVQVGYINISENALTMHHL